MNYIFEEDRIYAEEKGKLVAEITFPEKDKHVVEIDHTFVDNSMRGQGIGDDLMFAVVEQMRMSGKKIFPTCSFAAHWFSKHPEFANLLWQEAKEG